MATPPQKSPVNIDLGARADIKVEVKAEIPQDSAGRLVDAFTDMIRPFTEHRGLKADLIRLHREKVAIAIAKLALEKKRLRNEEIQPLPPKFLVPFFEKASLEDDEPVLIDMWAELLAGAPAGASASYLHFIDVMSRMTAKEAYFFKEFSVHVDWNPIALFNLGILNQDMVRRNLVEGVEHRWREREGEMEEGRRVDVHTLLGAAFHEVGRICYGFSAPNIVRIAHDDGPTHENLQELGWDSAYMDDALPFPPRPGLSGDEWVQIDNLCKVGLMANARLRIFPRVRDTLPLAMDVFFSHITRDGIGFAVNVGLLSQKYPKKEQ